ncbi:MAG: hypothetical protein JWN25_3398 [Verrucomicrobiales bacterium]|nr:hypothetical protein [Verrucomicrobiales bacterium]
MRHHRFWLILWVSMGLYSSGVEVHAEIIQASATSSELSFYFDSDPTGLFLNEKPTFKSPVVNRVECQRESVRKVGQLFRFTIPRYEKARDLASSLFSLKSDNGVWRLVEQVSSKNSEPYPVNSSKKGLQVQMVDDAVALGIKHAALNVDFSSLTLLQAGPSSIAHVFEGTEYFFSSGYLNGLDQQVKRLSDNSILVNLIILNYDHGDAKTNVLRHPHYDPSCPNHLGAFNLSTAEGIGHYKATIDFLASRYGAMNAEHGRVWGFIVGNEVNSHWEWYNLGNASVKEFVEDYIDAVRLCEFYSKKQLWNSRTYISLEHHWNMAGGGKGATNHYFKGKDMVDQFASQSEEMGGFAWNLAFHPYPENLFECRTWNDKTALPGFDTPRITFKNIEQLPAYFKRPVQLFHNSPRHIILSEQGFHSVNTPQGETNQAAAYAYAYYKIAHLDGIDSFILHRHVDHGMEGGLNLGLWTRNTRSRSQSEPERKKLIYEVFEHADKPDWQDYFRFALPVIGIKSWEDLLDSSMH